MLVEFFPLIASAMAVLCFLAIVVAIATCRSLRTLCVTRSRTQPREGNMLQ